MTAPARVRYRVDVPPDARLELLYGVDADTGWSLPGDGVTFAIDVAGEHVWKQRVDAHRLRRFRGWKSDVVDLRPWVGRKVPIDLLTMPGPDDRNDVGAFATARIVKSRNVERLLAHEAPTVIVILVDTLRADRLTAYGHDGGLTPNLDRLAADGVVFRNARSAASWTLPATTSILTGLSPADHGVIDARRSDLDDGIDTLAERFQLRGYTTGAFVTNPLIGPTSNLVQGFETFVAAPFLGARALNERVVAWLDGNVGVAHFVYVHAIDPHSPYEPEWREDVTDAPKGSEPEVLWYEMLQRGPFDEAAVATWREAVIPRYDADVRSFDTALGEFLEALEQRGVLEDAVIALVSDHGEEFFEHGQQGHGGQLYDETLAVPLIVTGFGRSELEPAVVDDPVRARRLLSTLCELAGVPLPDDPRVAGTLFASRNAGPAFSVTTHGYEPGIDGWTTKLCVVHRRSKLIHTPASGRTELYDLVDDPAEEHDLSAERPEEAAFLREQVLAWWATAGAADAEQGGEDAQTQAALRALGYVERTEKH